MDNLESLKVADLKKELKTRGLAIVGSKAELLARLQEAMATEKPGLDDSVLDDDSAILDDDDEDVLSVSNEGDSDDELVDVATKNGRPLEPLSSPKKTATPPSATHVDASIGENGDAEDDALPPKKRKKIQLNRDAVSTEVLAESEAIPTSAEAVPKAKAPEVVAPVASKHTPITAPESDGQKVVKLSAEALATIDKAKLRQQKFGAVTKDSATKLKAPAPAAAAVLSEKAKKRLEKFGGPAAVATVGKVSLTPEDEAKLSKRKERFGVIDMSDMKSSASTPTAANGQKEKRAARFGLGKEISTPEIEEKKKARAARFGGGT